MCWNEAHCRKKAKVVIWQNKTVDSCLVPTHSNLWMGLNLYLQNVCVGRQWVCLIWRECVSIVCAVSIFGKLAKVPRMEEGSGKSMSVAEIGSCVRKIG